MVLSCLNTFGMYCLLLWRMWRGFFSFHLSADIGFFSYCYFSEVLGVLFPQSLKTMPLLWIHRFEIFSLSFHKHIHLLLVNLPSQKSTFSLSLYIREDAYSLLLVILVHIVGMWYVLFKVNESDFIKFCHWNVCQFDSLLAASHVLDLFIKQHLCQHGYLWSFSGDI